MEQIEIESEKSKIKNGRVLYSPIFIAIDEENVKSIFFVPFVSLWDFKF